MSLRSGTYVRSENSDRQLYFSRNNYVDASDALVNDSREFEIVWDQYEIVELFMAMDSFIAPGEWVEILGKEVA